MDEVAVSAFKSIYRKGGIYEITEDTMPDDGGEVVIPAWVERVNIALGDYDGDAVAFTVILPQASEEFIRMRITVDVSEDATVTLEDPDGNKLGTVTDGTEDSVVESYMGLWTQSTASISTLLDALINSVNDNVLDCAATQVITVDTTAAIQAPNYGLLTQINDPDSDGVTFIVTPPVIPHPSRIWICEVVNLGTSTVTVNLETDITGLTDADIVLCYHDGDAWHALREVSCIADLIASAAALSTLTTRAATHEVTGGTTAQAPNYCCLTTVNDADAAGVITITPPVIPHVSGLWEVHVIDVNSATGSVTVDLPGTDVTALADGSRVLFYYNGSAWHALNEIYEEQA